MSDFTYWTPEGEGVADGDLGDMYDDWLDDCYGDASIAGCVYATSYALKELDPIAYRVGMSDWEDMMLTNGHLMDHDPSQDDIDE